MGRLDNLKETIASMASQSQSELVVVDYSCPQDSGNWVEEHYPQATVVRETGQRFYSAPKSRNIGARAANMPWLFFVDADVRLADGLTETLSSRLKKNCTYHAKPWIPGSMGSFLCHREAFEKVGGYDECLKGWGDEDRDLITRLRMAGYRSMSYPAASISILQHDDSLRTANYEIKDRERSHAINRTYMKAKHDLMRINETDALESEQLAEIYHRVADAVDKAARDSIPVELNLTAIRRLQPTGWSTDLTLCYRVVPPSG